MPIPGTTKLHRLEENLGATAVELREVDLATLAEAASEIEITGDRYSPPMQQMIDR